MFVRLRRRLKIFNELEVLKNGKIENFLKTKSTSAPMIADPKSNLSREE